MSTLIETIDYQKTLELVAAGLKSRGVIRLFFDLDDTIIPNREIFVFYEKKCLDLLASQLPEVPRQQLNEQFQQLNNKSHEVIGVSPKKWLRVLSSIAEIYPTISPAALTQSLAILNEIYSTPSTFLPGAQETLSTLHDAQAPISIVTHANASWTWRKYSWLDLDRYLPPEAMVIVDENGHKTDIEWAQGIKRFSVLPTEAIIAGDSPRTDINPALRAGVPPQNVFWIKRPEYWSVYKEDVPKEVTRLTSISELINVLITTS